MDLTHSSLCWASNNYSHQVCSLKLHTSLKKLCHGMWIASYTNNIRVYPVAKVTRWCACSYCELPNCMVYGLNNRGTLASKVSERCTDYTFGAPFLVQTVQANFVQFQGHSCPYSYNEGSKCGVYSSIDS